MTSPAFNFAHDMNFDFNYDAEDSDPEILKRKVIRGGSWKDISHFIQGREQEIMNFKIQQNHTSDLEM
jgi:hypothetical protein